jgi:hypothetical protein
MIFKDIHGRPLLFFLRLTFWKKKEDRRKYPALDSTNIKNIKNIKIFTLSGLGGSAACRAQPFTRALLEPY